MGKVFTQDQRDTFMNEIIERISNGETLRSISREEGMPSWSAVYDWLEADEALKTRFTHAREVGAEAIINEALLIADTPFEGVETEETDDGKIKKRYGDMLGHRKLQVETRFKLLSKWFPQKYGDKVDVNHGGQPNNPITGIVMTVVKPEND